jgi:surface antigen
MHQDWAKEDGLIGLTFNIIKWNDTKLSKVDRAYHTQAVYHALNHAENGEIVEWFSERSESQGKVQIVMTWTANGDICRRIHHYVRVDNKVDRSWGEQACMNPNTRRWIFSDK